MADLVTRLRADDKQFNDTIRKSQQQLKNFKAVGGMATKALGGIGLAIGAVTSAGDAFNKMMQNSQTFGDAMTKAITAAKNSVNEFFYALGTGDWSNIKYGMSGLIAQAKEAAGYLDQLGNTTISYGFVRGEARRETATAKVTANNKNLSEDERRKGYAAWSEGLKKATENAKVYEKAIIDATIALAKSNTHMSEANIDDIKEVIRLDAMEASKRDEIKKKRAAEYKEYLRQEEELKKAQTKRYNFEGKTAENGIKSMKESRELANKFSGAILYNNLLVRKSDEEWAKIVKMVQDADSATEELGSQQEEYQNSLREFETSLANDKKKKAQVKVEPVIQEGSIAKLEKELSEKNKQLKLEVDPASRRAIYREIKALEDKKVAIKFHYEHDTETIGALSGGKFGVDVPSIPAIDEKVRLPENNFGKAISDINDYAGALQQCSFAISAFNSTKFEDTGEGWSQYAANMLGNVAQMIIALSALASAKGVTSAMDLPFPANLAAAAVVLGTIVSMFASLPKFAEGGVVDSYLTSGDKNLIRVNGGEMILNKGQQANLFDLLDRGLPTRMGGNVQFRIEGKELVGVLNNYNNKVSKYRL